MNYQVIYESRSKNTKAVAEAIMDVLPAQSSRLLDFNKEHPSKDADVYCIGFGVHASTCSLKLLDFLELLNGKTILMFATCGMEPTDAYRNLLERGIEPFLPDRCDYRGMFLCQGAIPEDGAALLRKRAGTAGDQHTLQQLDALFASAQTHPDSADLVNAGKFVKAALGLWRMRPKSDQSSAFPQPAAASSRPCIGTPVSDEPTAPHMTRIRTDTVSRNSTPLHLHRAIDGLCPRIRGTNCELVRRGTL